MRVGDVLEVYTEVESVGRTSMKIHIEAWAQRFQTHHRDKVTDATFTFVHVGDDGRPRPIPPVCTVAIFTVCSFPRSCAISFTPDSGWEGVDGAAWNGALR